MYQIGKCQAMLVYMDTASLPSTTDWLLKWIDANNRQTYKNGWRKERLTWYKKKNPKKTNKQKEPLPTATNTYVENTNGTK